MREEIFFHGAPTLCRLTFVAHAAVEIAAATEACNGEDGSFGCDHDVCAKWAFDAAEALWTGLCKRFPEDYEVPDEEYSQS